MKTVLEMIENGLGCERVEKLWKKELNEEFFFSGCVEANDTKGEMFYFSCFYPFFWHFK